MSDSDGFTTIEVLISVTVLVILTLGIWTALSHVGRFLLTSSNRLQSGRQMIRLEIALRQEIGEIRFPYWIGDPDIDGYGNPLVIPYLNGEAEDTIRIKYVDHYLTIARNQGDTLEIAGVFGPFGEVEWVEDRYQGGDVRGFDFTIYPIEDNGGGSRDSWNLFVRLGSHPYPFVAQ